MSNVNQHQRFFYLNGMWDRLYQHYEDYQGEESEYAGLSRLAAGCPCPVRKTEASCTHNATWAVIKPSTGRMGTVLWSNSQKLTSGTVVHAKASWIRIRKPAAGEGFQNTVGSPGMLKIVSVPTRKRVDRPKAKVRRFPRRPSGRLRRCA